NTADVIERKTNFSKNISYLIPTFQVFRYSLYIKIHFNMDENLINQCRKMDRASQRKMYELLAPRLYLVCKRYLKQDIEIEEALADAFYTIFTKMDQLKENAAFEGWAKRIVINQCLLTIRRKPERQLYVEDVVITAAATEEHELEEQDLLKLLNHLPQGAK